MIVNLKAIVYTSNTGYTERYAKLLGELTGLEVYSLDNCDVLDKRSPIIYMGWLMAGSVKGYKKAAKKYNIRAICAVGLCDTGSYDENVRMHCKIGEDVAAFSIQGGMDINKLKGMNRSMINMLTRFMDKKKDRTEDEDRMLYLLKTGGDYVSEENLKAVLEWYNGSH